MTTETVFENYAEMSPEALLAAPVPDTYAGCLAMLRPLNILPRARRTLDRNGHPMPNPIEDRIAVLRHLIAKLANAAPTAPHIRQLGTFTGANLLIALSYCEGEIDRLKEKLNAYAALRKQFTEAGMLPGTAESLLKKVDSDMYSAADQAAIDALVDRKARLLEYSKNVSLGANCVCKLNALIYEISGYVLGLEGNLDFSLSHADEVCQKKEKEFFALAGLPHERTQLSRSVLQAKAHVSRIFEPFHHMMKMHETSGSQSLMNLDLNSFNELFDFNVPVSPVAPEAPAVTN